MKHRTVIAATFVGLFSSLAAAQLTLSPTTLTFATEALNTASAKQQVTVTNTSTSTAVSFTSITTSGNFSVASRTCSLETALAAGANCVIKVGFTPTAVGTNAGTLTLVDSASNSPQTVALKGVGTEVSLSPTSVNFGTQLLNATPAPTAVVLNNAGTTALNITAIAVTGDFQVASQNCIASGSTSGTVNAGASCTLNLSFVPTAVGKRTGTLTISDNGGGTTQSVALTGTATALSLSPSSLAFGSQYLNLPSGVKAVTIANVSPTTSFSVTGVSLSGTNGADFSQVSSCIPVGASTGKVLPNGQCAIFVTFEPTAAGSRTATMTITTNGGGAGTLSVALSGTGKGTGVVGVALSASVAGVPVNPSVAGITDTTLLSLTVTLTNTSNQNVTWTVDGVANGSSSVGTIASTGANTATYTPPTTDGSHTITATSVAATTSSASMTVTVTDYAGVFTYHNDNARDGQNEQETVLTPSNVNVAQFGKLFSYSVDGQVYAQPLYVANVSIPGQGFHNVLYVATENDSVYAFDADGLTTNPLWQVSFLGPNITPVASTAINANYTDLFPQIGITGTPVIDPTAGTLFVVSKTNNNGTYTQELHALNIATGAEEANSPIVISALLCDGNPCTTSVTTDKKTFSALFENQRPALLLLNGVVYIAWGSHGDIGVYHGWVIGYNETTLQQAGAYITTPVDSYGGIWQSGGGPAADSSGNIYVTSGNGPDDVATGGSDYSGAFLKLSTSGNTLAEADYFKPSTKTTDNSYEMSSGGPVLFPNQTGSFPHIAVVAGKDKNLYLVNCDSLGGASPTSSQLLQTITGAFEGGVFSTPSLWKSNVYVWAETDILRSYQLESGQLSVTATYPLNMGYPGAGTAVSSNGSQNAILWALDSKAILHAFDATNVAHEFYNSSEAGTRDTVPGNPVKFAVPTVANGKVYVGSADQVTGFGLLP
jgi:Abnormal spindle-like microcephaly-assoc'd, ASPM-SPD-2-Hydin